MARDRVYDAPRPQIVDFRFDAEVASVFPDMIRRSVPGYELVLPMTGLLAARYLKELEHPVVYDLGCSLGATSAAMLHALRALGSDPPGLEIRAVDSSAAMIERARETLTDPRVRFIEADVLHLALDACRVVTMNWILQFLPVAERDAVLGRIRQSLDPDGALILAEKVHLEDPDADAFARAVHEDFKRANGYSELEISQKRSALEDVLVTETIEAHVARLHHAGFTTVRVWFRCLNWASLIALP